MKFWEFGKQNDFVLHVDSETNGCVQNIKGLEKIKVIQLRPHPILSWVLMNRKTFKNWRKMRWFDIIIRFQMLSCYVPGTVKLSHQSIILLWGIRIIRVVVVTQLVISLISCCPCKMHATRFCENPGAYQYHDSCDLCTPPRAHTCREKVMHH